MATESHCQSCSRPLKGPSDCGTESDGARSALYCSCCYANGAFTEADVTMDQMLDRVVGIVIQHQIMPVEDARRKLPGYFRTLARWRSSEQPAAAT
jgi:hypothetical protein